MLPAGALLHGRYRIEGLIARGGMGAVYRARHDVLKERAVAIKEMAVETDDPDTRARAVEQFQREARFLAAIDHPGLVKILDYFEEADNQYLVMEFIDGRTLEDVMHSPQPVEISQVLGWGIKLCEVLGSLHRLEPPIVCRDLKPGNVILDLRGRVRLLDFGIARTIEANSETHTFIRGAGTPGYAPAEQFGSGNTDERADIYALGATLYSMLTKTVPPMSIAIMMGELDLKPPRFFNQQISPELDAFILKMMSVRRVDRPASMEEVQMTLSRLQSPLGGDTTLPIAARSDLTFATHRMDVPEAPSEPAVKASEVDEHEDLVPRKGVGRQDSREVSQTRLNHWRNNPLSLRRPPKMAEPEFAPVGRSAVSPAIAPMLVEVPDDVDSQSRWLSKLKDVPITDKPVIVKEKSVFSAAPIWLWKLAATLATLALTLPYYSFAAHVGMFSIFNLPGLIAAEVVSGFTGPNGIACAVGIMMQISLPLSLYGWLTTYEYRFGACFALVWFAINLLELAVCIRFADHLNLAFAHSYSLAWKSMLTEVDLGSEVATISRVLRVAGMLVLVTGVSMMVWQLFLGNKETTIELQD